MGQYMRLVPSVLLEHKISQVYLLCIFWYIRKISILAYDITRGVNEELPCDSASRETFCSIRRCHTVKN